MKRWTLALPLLAVACGGAQSPQAQPPVPSGAPPAAPSTPPLADYGALPKPGPNPSWSLPAATTWTLDNGMKVYYLRQGSTPLVSLLMVLPRGSATDPKGKLG